MQPRLLTLLPVLMLASVQAACGIILLDSNDPQHNTTTPGDNSGWQYEGQFGDFLGTPIAPQFFLTARHIGGYVGQSFVFHGATYTTTAGFSDPSSDLQIWQVDGEFPDYAPVYQSGAEVGQELRVFGRGTRRGAENVLGGTVRGWEWGPGDHVQRWGRNVVTGTLISDGAPYLQANFDSPGLPDEAHLSVGDSAGGVFIQEEGLWKLAAINYAVDDLFTAAGLQHQVRRRDLRRPWLFFSGRPREFLPDSRPRGQCADGVLQHADRRPVGLDRRRYRTGNRCSCAGKFPAMAEPVFHPGPNCLPRRHRSHGRPGRRWRFQPRGVRLQPRPDLRRSSGAGRGHRRARIAVDPDWDPTRRQHPHNGGIRASDHWETDQPDLHGAICE